MMWRTLLCRSVLDRFMLILRIAFGGLFVVSGILKLLDESSFQHVLVSLGFVPIDLVVPVGIILPLLEVILGGAIVFGVQVKLMSQSTLLLLSLFMAVIVAKLSEGTDFSCGCFGGLSREQVDGLTVLRNIVLMGVGYLLITYQDMPRNAPEEYTQSAYIAIHLVSIGRIARQNAQPIMVMLLITFLLGECFVLSAQNRVLKNRLQPVAERQNTLYPKASVPAFVAVNAEGHAETISYDDGRKTLLFIMRSSCNACKQNLPVWNRLAEMLKTSNVRIIGVLLDSTTLAKDYLRNNVPEFSTVSEPGREFREHYRIQFTPFTLLVSRGVVESVWAGTLDSLRQNQILKAVL